MVFRSCYLIFSLVLFSQLAQGQSSRSLLDPEATTPYRWQVGVRCTDHPILTPELRKQFLREIRATLQVTLGTGGEVEVVDLSNNPGDANPLWKAFAEKGWNAFEPDPLRELTGIKTHILTIDYQDGVFHLAARQLDGFTGIASPMLRSQTTRTTEMLGRIASLLIEPDFGPVGTVTAIPGEDKLVTVTWRGHQVLSPSRWVNIDDILMVSVIRDVVRPTDPKKPLPKDFRGQLPTMRTGVPFQYTLLKVIERISDDGSCKCKILTRFKDPFGRDALGRDARRRVGLRAMKLATIEEKIRLRLIDQNGQPHVRGSLLQVAGTDLDFDAQPGPQDILKYENGTYRSGRVFNHVACVQVGVEGGRVEFFPVPVLGQEMVLLRFDLKPEDEERALFARECNDYRVRVADLFVSQRALFEKVNKLLDLSKNREALGEAEAGQSRMAEARQALAEELKLMREKPRAGEENLKKILDASEKQLAAIEKGQKDLQRTMSLLQDAAKASLDPAKLEAEFRSKELAERIKDYTARGDVPEALEAYEKLINLLPARQDLKDAREKLLAEWSPKDEPHRKAREVMKKWQQAKTLDEYKESALALKVAVDVMVRKEDKLGLRKLLNTFEPAYAAIGKILNETKGVTEEEQKNVKEIEGLVELVRVVEDDAKIGLRKLVGVTSTPPPPPLPPPAKP